MKNITKNTFWARLSIGKKLFAIVLVFVLAFGGQVLQISSTIREQADDFVAVDVTGRQRMLNQQMTRQAVLLSLGLGDEEAFDDSRTLLQESLRTLIHGGSVVRSAGSAETVVVPPPPRDELRRALLVQEETLGKLLFASEAVAASSPEDPAYAERTAEMESINAAFHRNVSETVQMWTTVFEERTRRLLRKAILFSSLAALVAGAVAVFIARSIVRPLSAVVEQAQRVGRGDLTGDLLGPHSHDEVGKLAVAMDQMVENLRGLTGQTREVTANLAATVHQIYASTQQQSTASKELASSVQEITGTVQEIHQSGNQMGERAKEVSTTAEESSEAGDAGRLAALETNRNMDSIREQVEELAENIVSLSEKTQTIGEIISAVTDMAEQSNLLALNATIESASAGEHGSRFSVVASEMKNLADEAKASTVQVRTILGEIQRGINTSVLLTEETVKRVESGKSKADTAESTISRMREVTQESISAFQQIVGGTNQQQIGFEQVTKGMEDVRRACEQSAAGTSQLEEAASSLSALTDQLRASVETYRV